MLRNLALGAVLVAGVGLLLAFEAVPVWAHHAFAAEFDANKPDQVRESHRHAMEWVNPARVDPRRRGAA